MEEGDLLVQPNWTWHDHANNGKQAVMWIDILDAYLVHLLGARFHENLGSDAQLTDRPANFSNDHYGVVRNGEEIGTNPPYRYKWTDTWHALDTAAGLGPNSPFDGTLLSYKNPVTGGSTFKTMDCRIQLLQPGEETKTHRHGGIVLHHVFRGSGSTIVDDTVLDWGDKDCFMLPSWRWHHHRNNSKTEPAILFTVTDRPALEAFDLYREEAAEA
jgi:gentisate 1,2-dioxygenase